MKKLGTRTIFAAAALMAGTGIMLASAAQADLTIVSKVDVSGLPTPQNDHRTAPGAQGAGPGGPQGEEQGGGPGGSQNRGRAGAPPQYPQIITTYIKGTSVRTEVKDGPIRIYNAERKRVYVLNTKDKTYYTEDVEDTQRRTPFGSLKVDSTVALKPVDAIKAENSAFIAGVKAQKYGIAGSLNVSLQRSDDAGDAPPPPDAQSAPPSNDNGGTQSNSRRGRGRGNMPTGPITVAGEVWVANGTKGPDDKFLLDALYSPVVTLGRMRMLTEPIYAQLQALPGLPVKSKVIVAATMRGTAVKITTTYTVQSLKTDALDDALFDRPSDFEHIDAPSFGRNQGRGGRGERGGGNGGDANGGGGGQGDPGGAPPPNEN